GSQTAGAGENVAPRGQPRSTIRYGGHPMSGVGLLTLARAMGEKITALFVQIITNKFAMVVAIYYFLNQARLPMKVFAFLAYGIGMLMFFGRALEETNMLVSVLGEMRALPHPGPLVQRYLALQGSWLAVTTSGLFNIAYWILWLGVFYLLF